MSIFCASPGGIDCMNRRRGYRELRYSGKTERFCWRNPGTRWGKKRSSRMRREKAVRQGCGISALGIEFPREREIYPSHRVPRKGEEKRGREIPVGGRESANMQPGL